jgi:methylamine---glutamate N-methyltransferase subunit A
MCGIVGLFLKNPAMESRLGQFTAGMLQVMTERGPDSAGFALYGDGAAANLKLTLRGTPQTNFEALAAAVGQRIGQEVPVTRHDDHAVLRVPAVEEAAARAAIAALAPEIRIVSFGEAVELYKGVGLPRAVADRFGLSAMSGTHAIGHTRMATESAVTTAGAHPFSTGPDQCMVHNGSLSNHNDLRRRLQREGQIFETENDTEVAANYLSWRMAQGARLDEALTAALSDLDGFYTFVVGTKSGFGVLRDPVACKPAVMAETDDYVAFGSEYRALVDLPDIDNAHIFEPEPQRVYFWERPV